MNQKAARIGGLLLSNQAYSAGLRWAARSRCAGTALAITLRAGVTVAVAAVFTLAAVRVAAALTAAVTGTLATAVAAPARRPLMIGSALMVGSGS